MPTTTASDVNRGTRAAVYFFFAVVSLLLGSIAVYASNPIVLIGQLGNQPWLEIYGWLIQLVAIVSPILFVVAAFYALLFGHDR
jgi:hypothetical protein